jgi:hypothetical protein
LVTRLGGLLLVAGGLADGLGSLLASFGLRSSPYYTASNLAAAGSTYLAVGLVLILAADLITRLIYGRGE